METQILFKTPTNENTQVIHQTRGKYNPAIRFVYYDYGIIQFSL